MYDDFRPPDEDRFDGDPDVWCAAGAGFIESDVIRWVEPVWKRRARNSKRRPLLIAEREIIAEVIAEESDGMIELAVLDAEVTWILLGTLENRVPRCEKGHVIRRQRRTIARKPERVYRMFWSDESARDVLCEEAGLSDPTKQ